ncbi:hypothetical protein B0T25DRAFT_562080 [Lasiosphaeria hispida]|uniref:Ankyrin repeat protein n=1 Tax=Lasiosphaeria hispida TaxID=260671 RepID=A0AAJ0MJR9_9PEZI|nr:hypothetical protein B0T25DRAFT_562080 [Lasiosphaeria hispida]
MSELVGMLLARGAAPELCDAEGNNALHYAAAVTPLDLALERTATEMYMSMAEGVRAVGRHADVVVFLETGVVVGDEV